MRFAAEAAFSVRFLSTFQKNYKICKIWDKLPQTGLKKSQTQVDIMHSFAYTVFVYETGKAELSGQFGFLHPALLTGGFCRKKSLFQRCGDI